MSCSQPSHNAGESDFSRHLRYAAVGKERHEGRDESSLLRFRKRGVTATVRGDLRESGIRGEEMIPFREVLMHGLGSGGSDRIGVLPNLVGDVEQGEHDRDRPDDLPKVRQVSEIHVSFTSSTRNRLGGW